MNVKDTGSNKQIENWFREIFTPPDSANINISEEDHLNDKGIMNSRTNIIIKIDHKNPGIYSILKPVSEICLGDIVFLKKSMESYISEKYPVRSRLYKFFGWWIIFAGAFTVFSVCPICGQIGCPVGVGTTGILAGVLALVKMGGKNCVSFLKTLFKTIKKNKNEF